MKGAAQWGFVAVLAGVLTVFLGGGKAHAQPTPAAEKTPIGVTDADRVFKNFTRESATVNQGQIRVEVRALRTEELADGGDPDCRGPNRANCARLNTIGQRIIGVTEVKGGTIDLLASYGLTENVEIGGILPFIIETVNLDSGENDTKEGIGDVLFYGKFKQALAEHWTVTGGLEMTVPSGDDSRIRTMPKDLKINGSAAGKGYSAFGTGEVGLNPFVSTRYQMGRFGVGGHMGYNFITGDNVPEVFNYSGYGIIRGNEFFSFRAEVSGRQFDQFGTAWSDVVVFPGIDFNLSEQFTIRPEGMANLTGTAQDWGIGLGIAGVF